jgi:hypothetical protein
MTGDSPFPEGLIVYFRVMDTTNNQLARSYHLTGRQVMINHKEDAYPDDYVIFDENDKLLGLYPRDFVSAILPIITVGPGAADADNSEITPPNLKKAKARNPSRLS